MLGRVEDPRTLAAAELPVPPAALAELIDLVEKWTLSGKQGKEVFGRMWQERRRALHAGPCPPGDEDVMRTTP